eukprot:Sspe_Gene.18277::Locus_6556_Transcript_1_1_Confidence_1.000_Length_2544::g.18277::m.18277
MAVSPGHTPRAYTPDSAGSCSVILGRSDSPLTDARSEVCLQSETSSFLTPRPPPRHPRSAPLPNRPIRSIHIGMTSPSPTGLSPLTQRGNQEGTRLLDMLHTEGDAPAPQHREAAAEEEYPPVRCTFDASLAEVLELLDSCSSRGHVHHEQTKEAVVARAGKSRPRSDAPRSLRTSRKTGSRQRMTADERVAMKCDFFRSDMDRLMELRENIAKIQAERRTEHTNILSRNVALLSHPLVAQSGGQGARVAASRGQGRRPVVVKVCNVAAHGAHRLSGEYTLTAPVREAGELVLRYRQEGGPGQLISDCFSMWRLEDTESGEVVEENTEMVGRWGRFEVAVVKTREEKCRETRWDLSRAATGRVRANWATKMASLPKDERLRLRRERDELAQQWVTHVTLASSMAGWRIALLKGRGHRALQLKGDRLSNMVAAKMMPVVHDTRKRKAVVYWSTIRHTLCLFWMWNRAQKRRVCVVLVAHLLSIYGESSRFIRRILGYRQRVVRCQRFILWSLQWKRTRTQIDMMLVHRAEYAAKVKLHKEYLIKWRKEDLRRQREAKVLKTTKKGDKMSTRHLSFRALSQKYFTQQGVLLGQFDDLPQVPKSVDIEAIDYEGLPPLTDAGKELLELDSAPSLYPIPFSSKLRLVYENQAFRHSEHILACRQYESERLTYEGALMAFSGMKTVEALSEPERPHYHMFIPPAQVDAVVQKGLWEQTVMENEIKEVCARLYPDSVYSYMAARDSELQKRYLAEVANLRDFFAQINSLCRYAPEMRLPVELTVEDLMKQCYLKGTSAEDIE